MAAYKESRLGGGSFDPYFTEWLRLAGTSGGHKQAPPTATCSGPQTAVILQGWQLHNFPGQSVTVLDYPHHEKVFPDAHVYVMDLKGSQLGSSTIKREILQI